MKKQFLDFKGLSLKKIKQIFLEDESPTLPDLPVIFFKFF